MIVTRNWSFGNDHSAFDAWWLWTSETITNGELEQLYQERYPDEFTNTSPTLERLIELEESEQYQYSYRGQQQSPIIVSGDQQVGMFVSATRNQLWDTPILTNTQILSFWEGNDKPTEEQFKQLLGTLPEYQPPIENEINWSSMGVNNPDQPWLWSSAILTNGDLEQVYESQLGTNNFTLQHILDTEETSDPSAQYSKRGSSQTPVEITET